MCGFKATVVEAATATTDRVCTSVKEQVNAGTESDDDDAVISASTTDDSEASTGTASLIIVVLVLLFLAIGFTVYYLKKKNHEAELARVNMIEPSTVVNFANPMFGEVPRRESSQEVEEGLYGAVPILMGEIRAEDEPGYITVNNGEQDDPLYDTAPAAALARQSSSTFVNPTYDMATATPPNLMVHEDEEDTNNIVPSHAPPSYEHHVQHDAITPIPSPKPSPKPSQSKRDSMKKRMVVLDDDDDEWMMNAPPSYTETQEVGSPTGGKPKLKGAWGEKGNHPWDDVSADDVQVGTGSGGGGGKARAGAGSSGGTDDASMLRQRVEREEEAMSYFNTRNGSGASAGGDSRASLFAGSSAPAKGPFATKASGMPPLRGGWGSNNQGVVPSAEEGGGEKKMRPPPARSNKSSLKVRDPFAGASSALPPAPTLIGGVNDAADDIIAPPRSPRMRVRDSIQVTPSLESTPTLPGLGAGAGANVDEGSISTDVIIPRPPPASSGKFTARSTMPKRALTGSDGTRSAGVAPTAKMQSRSSISGGVAVPQGTKKVQVQAAGLPDIRARTRDSIRRMSQSDEFANVEL
jgi:hypothetical protein